MCGHKISTRTYISKSILFSKWHVSLSVIVIGNAVNTLWVAMHCSAMHCSVLQRGAVRCSALQCVAVRCSASQCVAVRCSALPCICAQYHHRMLPVCCSLLQCALNFVCKAQIEEVVMVMLRSSRCGHHPVPKCSLTCAGMYANIWFVLHIVLVSFHKIPYYINVAMLLWGGYD